MGELDQKAGKATCEWGASRDTGVGAGKSACVVCSAGAKLGLRAAVRAAQAAFTVGVFPWLWAMLTLQTQCAVHRGIHPPSMAVRHMPPSRTILGAPRGQPHPTAALAGEAERSPILGRRVPSTPRQHLRSVWIITAPRTSGNAHVRQLRTFWFSV